VGGKLTIVTIYLGWGVDQVVDPGAKKGYTAHSNPDPTGDFDGLGILRYPDGVKAAADSGGQERVSFHGQDLVRLVDVPRVAVPRSVHQDSGEDRQKLANEEGFFFASLSRRALGKVGAGSQEKRRKPERQNAAFDGLNKIYKMGKKMGK
jgi:hypothetical protein